MIPDLEPMLASTGLPLDGIEQWAAEPKWDGWRARVAVSQGRVVVRTRTGRAITHAVPGVAPFAGHGRRLLLDGEIVAGAGRLADFYGLSGRVAGRRGSTPVVFVAFDVLVDGEPVFDRTYTDRRRALEALQLPGLVVTPSYPGEDAHALLAACEDTGMEGVVLKRLDSPYLPGTRSDAWRKVKCTAWPQHARARFAASESG